MALLEWLIVAAAAFGGLVSLMYVAQRSLMYFPERLNTQPAMAGFAEAQEVALDTKDGERVIVWHLPPRGEKAGGAVFPRQWRSIAQSCWSIPCAHCRW